MRFVLIVFSVLLLTVSCQSEKLLLNNVSSLSIEIDRNAVLNVGNEFSYTIYADLNSGETRKVKNDEMITFPDGQLKDAGQHRAIINQPLNNFETISYGVEIGLEIGDYKVSSTDTIDLNFKGPIVALWSGAEGRDGIQPRASTATLFSRDGLEGRPGENGRNGRNGRSFTGYLWQEQDELRLLLVCDSSDQQFCYRSIQRDSVYIDLSGGDAGDGSRGGTGGDGKPAKKEKAAGNGANGGPGGNGGNGGDGGSLLLFIHPNASYMSESITLINSGGKGGKAGIGGHPGKAGKGADKETFDGWYGEMGQKGRNGYDGPAITISKVAFDFSLFQ